jgi:hypothetical protein
MDQADEFAASSLVVRRAARPVFFALSTGFPWFLNKVRVNKHPLGR